VGLVTPKLLAAVLSTALLVTPKLVPTSDTASETLEVTYPPASWLGYVMTAALEGTDGSTLAGTFHTVGTDYYVWYSHHDGTEYVGVDPGDREPSLAGMTGVEVQLAAGNHTTTSVATATETAWNAAGTGISIVRASGVGTYTGSIDAAASFAGGTWDTRSAGHGGLGTTDMISTSSFAVDSTRWMQIDPANVPSVAFSITGVEVLRANDITNPVRLMVAVGGADGDPENAVVVAQKVVASPAAIDSWAGAHFSAAEAQHFAAAAAPTLWIGIQGDGATSAISAENNAAAHGEFLVTTGTVLYVTGEQTGSATAADSPVGPVTSSNGFAIFCRLKIQTGPNWYGDGSWRSWCGPTEGRNDTFGSTSNVNSIWVSWAWALPNIEDMMVYECGFSFGAHASDQQFRVELWADTADITDADTDTILHDFGETSGSATGQYYYSPTPFSLTGNQQVRIDVKGTNTGVGGPGASTFEFNVGDQDEINTPDDWGWPAGSASAGASEVEYTAANGETVIEFESNTATTSPLAPDSVALTPGNSGSLSMQIGHAGFALVANP